MTDFFDQYSVLHFATGVTAYFWGVNPWVWGVGHLAWEGFENSGAGMQLVNRFWHWPGRKGPMKQDTLANTIGDNISAQAGYWYAKWLDDYGKEHDWYGGKYDQG